MEKQTTLKEHLRIEGVGIHSGKKVAALLKPAPVNTGIKFIRSDLQDKPFVNLESCSEIDLLKNPRRTSVGAGDISVQTVEHLMAAFAGVGIDNVLVEVNTEELPCMDGSAAPFVEAILRAGIQEQDSPRKIFVVKEPVYCDEGEKSIVVLPYDGFKISYTLDHNSDDIATQFFEYEFDKESFAADIAPSRTFCREAEAESLLSMGLGKGANYENTLVVKDGKVINNELRFADEFARHKILDLIGDLYLLGMPIRGHVIAIRSGHALNIKLLQRIRAKRERLIGGGIIAEGMIPESGMLDINTIQKILPHRYPFLLVDRIIGTDEKHGRIIGIKNVTVNDNFFTGHFPGRPVMPGVLIIEAMAQTAGVLMLSKEENFGRLAFFTSMNNVKFRKPVIPGDQLVFECQILRARSRMGTVQGVAKVDGKVACEAVLGFAIADV